MLIGNHIRKALQELQEMVEKTPHGVDCEQDYCDCGKEEALDAITNLFSCLEEMT